MKTKETGLEEDFNPIPEEELGEVDESDLESDEAHAVFRFATNFLTQYAHENSRGDSRSYYPKENSKGWIGANQSDYFVMYSIPADGGRTAVASIWVENEKGEKNIIHYDLGKLLTPILRHYTSLEYPPASYGE
jgi:hypothetical protein